MTVPPLAFALTFDAAFAAVRDPPLAQLYAYGLLGQAARLGHGRKHVGQATRLGHDQKHAGAFLSARWRRNMTVNKQAVCTSQDASMDVKRPRRSVGTLCDAPHPTTNQPN